jgi:hypothetical protein
MGMVEDRLRIERMMGMELVIFLMVYAEFWRWGNDGKMIYGPYHGDT